MDVPADSVVRVIADMAHKQTARLARKSPVVVVYNGMTMHTHKCISSVSMRSLEIV